MVTSWIEAILPSTMKEPANQCSLVHVYCDKGTKFDLTVHVNVLNDIHVSTSTLPLCHIFVPSLYKSFYFLNKA